ncbi:MAG: PTS sugar transporter subunit IIA [Phyllobacteriaceae bacterium]|nr:PTS sugar transporter subunit IIA [Phyllobacteriaceae bacterium]
MTTADPLRPDAIFLDFPAQTKADVLKALAARAGEIAVGEPVVIARALTERERLGSTGVGAGVALPHAAIDGLVEPVVLFARLARPIDWEAVDDEPVDLVAVVLSPSRGAGASLNLLAKFARWLRDAAARDKLRACTEVAEVQRAFAGTGG